MSTPSPRGMNSVSYHPASPHTTTLFLSSSAIHMEWFVVCGGYHRLCVCVEVEEGRGEVDRKMTDSCALARFNQSTHNACLVSDCHSHTAPSKHVQEHKAPTVIGGADQDLQRHLAITHGLRGCKRHLFLLTKRSCPAMRHPVSLGCFLGPVPRRAPLTRTSSVSALRRWHTLCLSPSFHQACLPSHAVRLSALVATSSNAGVCGDEEK
jgi:hypothetical protein